MLQNQSLTANKELTYKSKKLFEIRTSYKMGQDVVKLVQKKLFPIPSSNSLRSRQSLDNRARKESFSTAASTSIEEEPREEEQYHHLISQQIAIGNNKIRTVLENFSAFEDRLTHSLKTNKIKIFQNELFSILGKVLGEKSTYEKHDALLLSLSMIFIAAGRIGLRQNQLVLLSREIKNMEITRATKITKSLCYRTVKSIFLIP